MIQFTKFSETLNYLLDLVKNAIWTKLWMENYDMNSSEENLPEKEDYEENLCKQRQRR